MGTKNRATSGTAQRKSAAAAETAAAAAAATAALTAPVAKMLVSRDSIESHIVYVSLRAVHKFAAL